MKLSITTLDAEIERTRVDNLKDRVLWDSTMIGFGARISPLGKVSFILMYRHQGRRRKLTLGRYGSITLFQAKEQAKNYMGEILGGEDPAGKKRELQTGFTIKDLCKHYIEHYAPSKKSGSEDIRNMNKYVIPRIGFLKVAAVSYHDILKFHREIEAKITANRCLSLVSKLFSLAKEWKFIDSNTVNPAQGIKKNSEHSRNRYIRDDEMPRLITEIINYPDPVISGALQISLFTGVRQARVMSLEWSDINFDAKLLYERNSKTAKTEKEVFSHPLTTNSVEVLLSLPRKDKYLFLDGVSRAHQTKRLRRAWKEIKMKAGINEAEGQELWLHDLRRTLGSWLVKNNYSTNIAKQALNHKSLQAAQRYQHINDGDTVRLALEDVTQKMLDSAKP